MIGFSALLGVITFRLVYLAGVVTEQASSQRLIIFWRSLVLALAVMLASFGLMSRLGRGVTMRVSTSVGLVLLALAIVLVFLFIVGKF